MDSMTACPACHGTGRVPRVRIQVERTTTPRGQVFTFTAWEPYDGHMLSTLVDGILWGRVDTAPGPEQANTVRAHVLIQRELVRRHLDLSVVEEGGKLVVFADPEDPVPQLT